MSPHCLLSYVQVPTPRPCEQEVRKWVSPWWENIEKSEMAALLYAGSFASFLAHRDLHDRVLLYEDLSADPEAAAADLLGLMEVAPEHLEKAMSAFRRDSQRGTLAARGRFSGEDRVPAATWEAVDAVFAQLGLPLRCGMSEEEYRAAVAKGQLTN